MKRLRVLMTRQEIVPERLAGATAVVLDVLMATTTLLTILENGARGVYPVESLEEADSIRDRLDASSVLRGGEQAGGRIDGYDHGPLPDEYAPEVVADKDVIFVTTNGTRALADAAPAERVLLGNLRNAPAVARHLKETGSDSVYLICAGGGGRFSLEDFVGAATVMSFMDLEGWRLNDAALLALDFVRRHPEPPLEVIRDGRVARWFTENGQAKTLEFVADVGASGTVPEVVGGRLRRVDEPEDCPPLEVSDSN